MGITAPGLYAAYGDKQQLFLEAMRLYAGSPYDMEQALSEAPTAHEAAQCMRVAAAEAFTGDLTPRGCLLASATASGSDASAEVRHAVAQIRRQIRRRIKRPDRPRFVRRPVASSYRKRKPCRLGHCRDPGTIGIGPRWRRPAAVARHSACGDKLLAETGAK